MKHKPSGKRSVEIKVQVVGAATAALVFYIAEPRQETITNEGGKAVVLSPFWLALKAKAVDDAKNLALAQADVTVPIGQYSTSAQALKMPKGERHSLQICVPYLTNDEAMEKGARLFGPST